MQNKKCLLKNLKGLLYFNIELFTSGLQLKVVRKLSHAKNDFFDPLAPPPPCHKIFTEINKKLKMGVTKLQTPPPRDVICERFIFDSLSQKGREFHEKSHFYIKLNFFEKFILNFKKPLF